ncbi:hypothetical protein ACJ41O_000355 [Fusarium nematophilum]
MRFQALALAALCLVPGITATPRAEADIYGCVYFEQKPVEPFTVTFTPGSDTDHNMNPKGYQNSTVVSDSGVSCAYLGHPKEVDRAQKTRWSLSYSGGPYRGFTSSEWAGTWGKSGCRLKDYDPSTYVCTSDTPCGYKYKEWEGNGPLYV